MTLDRSAMRGMVAVCAIIAASSAASAGGFSIREQSTSSQGMSFAGNAASNDLSAMFWNPAAAANKQGPGLNSESNYTLIVPRAEIDITSATHPLNAGINGQLNSGAFGNSSGDIGALAVLGASYYSYQFSNFDPNLFLGLALNSPFGLKTDLEKSRDTYKGSVVGRESKLLTFNVNPMLAYRLSPALTVGVGAQFQYGKGRFSFATGLPNGQDTRFDGSGVAVGATAGLMWNPAAGTTIGLGWRSQMSQHLDGAYINTPGTSALGLRSVDATTTLELPNTVTLSVRQAVTSSTRVMGTAEWSQWSRFKALRLSADGASPSVLAGGVIVPTPTGNASLAPTVPGTVIGVLPANWSDGWFFALGGEVDVTRQFTLRAGGAYEISPIDDPHKRLIGIPDSDRIWASLGASYRWSETLSFDVAYTHVFFKESTLNRDSLSGVNVIGNVDASTDIVSVAMKSRW